MIKVIITYSNEHIEKTSVKNDEVARKFIDAVISVYKHDGLIETIEKIDLVDTDKQTSSVIYRKGSKHANHHDLLNHHCSTCGSCHHRVVLEGDKA